MEQHFLVTLGRRLQSLRLESGKTQKSMAEYLGCTTSNYQKIEYGQVNIPALTIIALAQYFHVSTDYLLGLRDER
ncbi:helix-turn-helix domain-containing protein [uncultured Dysosmobacter sp.]|uniref:helix-turn-helix domain-containing protein n=1 Tax=uncultured Dysosmobacter sp. TaxID=2591384 RepID=UPI0026167F37|nr:helix-turn-helix transcriptional regulator [uncultured Dysosmobacter sp.]